MRWTVRIGIMIIVLLWAGYAASPYVAVYRFANALQQRDMGAIASRVNFPAVRRSLTEQIAATYLQLTGKDARLGQFGRGIAIGVAVNIADPMVAKLISAEALVDLLQNAGAAAEPSGNGAAFPGSDSGWLGNVWQVFIHSEHGLRSFAVAAPLSAPPSRRFRLMFRLTNWTWTLSAIELPDELRVRLAQDLIKQTDGK